MFVAPPSQPSACSLLGALTSRAGRRAPVITVSKHHLALGSEDAQTGAEPRLEAGPGTPSPLPQHTKERLNSAAVLEQTFLYWVTDSYQPSLARTVQAPRLWADRKEGGVEGSGSGAPGDGGVKSIGCDGHRWWKSEPL